MLKELFQNELDEGSLAFTPPPIFPYAEVIKERVDDVQQLRKFLIHIMVFILKANSQELNFILAAFERELPYPSRRGLHIIHRSSILEGHESSELLRLSELVEWLRSSIVANPFMTITEENRNIITKAIMAPAEEIGISGPCVLDLIASYAGTILSASSKYARDPSDIRRAFNAHCHVIHAITKHGSALQWHLRRVLFKRWRHTIANPEEELQAQVYPLCANLPWSGGVIDLQEALRLV